MDINSETQRLFSELSLEEKRKILRGRGMTSLTVEDVCRLSNIVIDVECMMTNLREHSERERNLS